jgi:hypothetical protein
MILKNPSLQRVAGALPSFSALSASLAAASNAGVDDDARLAIDTFTQSLQDQSPTVDESDV